jgi:hypothetical protein
VHGHVRVTYRTKSQRNVKVKVTLHQAVKAQRGSRGVALLLL